jgi:hypothetical protein
MYKKACKEMNKVGLGVNGTSYQILDGDLDKIAKIFNLQVTKVNEYGHYDGTIFIDDFKLYAYTYDFEKVKKLNYSDKNLQQQLREFFFELGDKEKAFEKMKLLEEERCEKDYRYQKYSWLNKYKTLQALEKRFNRALKKTYEQMINEYLAYKSSWEKYEGRVTWGDYDRIRPMHDYDNPATFKQWYEFNY